MKDINIENFDYPLPDERIPRHPLEKRDECKLLLRSPEGVIYHRKFKELPDLLPTSSLLICNDTKVINARLSFHKNTGASVELFLLEPIDPADYALNFQSRQFCKWKCLVGNSRKWKEGELYAEVPIDKEDHLELKAVREGKEQDGSSVVTFYWNRPEFTFARIIEMAGKIPIPPYLNRETEETDKEDYQTVYARVKGSVAAPTAGLHFTPEVFEALEAHGVQTGKVTLHVGAGTFKPVKSETIGDHSMHSEPFIVSLSLLEKIVEWKKNGKPVVAVGTTSVRTLESLPYIGRKILQGEEGPYNVGQWEPYEEGALDIDTIESLEKIIEKLKGEGSTSLSVSTSIMIAPGFNWRITDATVTNFHQPKSTLLLLVSSFLGGEDWKKLYQEALDKDYRFLSYGDACLLIKRG